MRNFFQHQFSETLQDEYFTPLLYKWGHLIYKWGCEKNSRSPLLFHSIIIQINIRNRHGHGGLVVNAFASRVEGTIPAAALTVWSLHVLPILQGFPLGTSVSSHQSKDMHCRLVDMSKVSI